MIGKLRAMDDRVGYGQLCRVIKDVNSEIRQGRKESFGAKPIPRKVGRDRNGANVPPKMRHHCFFFHRVRARPAHV